VLGFTVTIRGLANGVPVMGLSGSDTICSGLLAIFIGTGVGKLGFECDRCVDGVVAAEIDFLIGIWDFGFGAVEFNFVIGMRSCVC